MTADDAALVDPVGSALVDAALVERVRRSLAGSAGGPSPARVARALRAEAGVLDDTRVLAVTDRLSAELAGAGPLEPLLRRPGVTDVLVNGALGVWVDAGRGLERVPLRLGGAADVRRLAVRLAASAGRRLDDAAPWVDGCLPDGTRLHAVLPPVAPDGPCVSLRRPPERAYDVAELVASGSWHPVVAEVLRAVVGRRLSFLVTGGTGTGKTTVLAALLSLVDPAERVVVVEDTAELRPAHPHVVRLLARPPNVEGTGAVPLADLVRQALRMRPDRIVLGEVRGAEVVDLLGALNTGHDGGCGTVHARDVTALPARLEALGTAAGLPRPAVHSQLAGAVDVVVHLARGPDGRRRVAQLGVLGRGTDGLVAVRPALGVDAAGALSEGPAAEVLAALVGLPRIALAGPATGGGRWRPAVVTGEPAELRRPAP